MKNKILKLCFFCFLILFLPVFLNECIFNNTYISNVSNDGWASFFGSYLGGIIGGLGTLIAMYITLKNTQQQILNSEKKEQYREKKDDATEIMNLVAAYLSNISIYHDDKETYLSKKKDIESKKKNYKKLLEIWSQFRCNADFSYTDYLCELKNQNVNYLFAKNFFKKRNNEHYEQNKISIYNEYEENLNIKIIECNERSEDLDHSIKISREKNVIGCKYFWMLEIKLEEMTDGKVLLNSILKLHNMSKMEPTSFSKKEISNINDMISEIKQETRSFFSMHMKL